MPSCHLTPGEFTLVRDDNENTLNRPSGSLTRSFACSVVFLSPSHPDLHIHPERWTFVAAAYDQGAGNATLYVDGVTVSSQTRIQRGSASGTGENAPRSLGPDFSLALVAGMRIGAGPDGAEEGSTGLIAVVDEAFVYGASLTVEELDYLYGAAQVRRSSLCRRGGGDNTNNSGGAKLFHQRIW